MGDPACFLSSTCIACGRFLEESDLAEDSCPHCDAELGAHDAPLRFSRDRPGGASRH